MLVKIISGGYGLHNGRRIVLKDKFSAPFKLDDNEAERLIALGVAQRADAEVATLVPPVSDVAAGETPVDEVNSAEDDFDNIPNYSIDMTVAQLCEIARQFDVQIEPSATKAAIIAALDEEFKGVDLVLGTAEPVI